MLEAKAFFRGTSTGRAGGFHNQQKEDADMASSFRLSLHSESRLCPQEDPPCAAGVSAGERRFLMPHGRSSFPDVISMSICGGTIY